MLAILNSLGAGEAIAILVIALIVLGPEKLPDAIRKFGNIYGELRRMSHGFQSELRDAFDEPLRELRGTAQSLQDAINEPAKAVKTEMTAPVVGGGKKAAEATAATAAAEPTAADGADGTSDASAHESQTPAEETQPAVEETQTPVEESQDVDIVDAGADQPADDGQPVLAQAGLMVSEPELSVVASNGTADEAATAEEAATADEALTADEAVSDEMRSAEDEVATDVPRDR